MNSEFDMLRYEKYYAEKSGCRYIAGVDEAGRGPLAGPVCAAAVIFPPDVVIEGINDSKKLTEKQREKLFDEIKEKALAYSIAWGSLEEIEELNILQAAMLAMKRAIEGLSVQPDFVLVDGNKRPDTDIPCLTIIKGDAHSQSIAAASILAKVSRDRLMVELSAQYPEYEFDKHKGYGTKLHREKLLTYGPCAIHRPSFMKKIFSPPTKKKPTRQKAAGNQGEEQAVEYLQNRGYTLVERNYTSPYGEIDIIVQDAEYLVFVEVKARQWDAIARPADSVNKGKRKKLLQTAEYYMQEHPTALTPRMDVIEVVFNPTDKDDSHITHIECAFGEEPS